MLVSFEWLKQHISDDNIVIIDTRPKIAFLYGHLANSQCISIEQIIKTDRYGSNLVADKEDIEKLFSSIGIDETKTVIVCGEYMDPSVARMTWTISYHGHQNTKILQQSISSIPQAELTKRPYTPTPTKFTSNIDSRFRIKADDLKKELKSYTILDARTPQEFMGGHLPESKLVPFTNGLGANGEIFANKESLKVSFRDIPKDRPIVCYCMHGHRAASLFYQLKLAGFDKVMLYDGSFVEWYGLRFPLD